MAGEIGALPTDSGGLQPTYDVVTIGAGGEIGKLGDAVVGKLADAVTSKAAPETEGVISKAVKAVKQFAKNILEKFKGFSRAGNKAAKSTTGNLPRTRA